MEYLSSLLEPNVAFDGWAVALISAIISLVLGGLWKHKRLTSKNITQKQTAKNKASQTQEVRSNTIKDINIINQEQEAGGDSTQNQII